MELSRFSLTRLSSTSTLMGRSGGKLMTRAAQPTNAELTRRNWQ
jgi:hypothetical protein